jgi:hypothetical protein
MRSIALVVLLPFAAFAQTSNPEYGFAPAGSWSMGAGVGFDLGFFVGSPVNLTSLSIGPPYISPPVAPTAVVSLERRLSARDWLVLGVNGSYARDRQDLVPGRAGVKKSDLNTLAVAVGLRHVLTPAGAPVDVSFDVLANAGATRWKGDAAYYDSGAAGAIADASFDESVWRAGATFGIAVERELTSALSLRVATPIVGAWYGETRSEITGQPTLEGEDLGAGLALAPRLELRLAF